MNWQAGNCSRWLFLSVVVIFSCHEPAGKQPGNSVDTSSKKDIIPTQDVAVVEAGNSDAINLEHTRISLHPQAVRLQNGDTFTLNVPMRFHLTVAAETGSRLRFIATSPHGRLFVTDMHDRGDNHMGRVFIFDNWDDSAKRFTRQYTYLKGLHNPNQVAFHDQYIYVAETGKLRRFAYSPGDTAASDSGQVIAEFPDYGLSYKYGGWHLTRSLAFHNNKLYVSIGSSCNACLEKEDIRAVVLQMDPDGGNKSIFARGLRNSVGIKWIGNHLWGTGMGRDLIGPDKPEDLFQEIRQNEYYGWPFYYQYQQQVFADDQFSDSVRQPWVKSPPVALLGFKAHSAPLGFAYFKDFSEAELNNTVLVCLHGSTSVWRQRGNAIVRVEKDNHYTDIVNGFLTGKTEAERHGRPCDILMNSNHSFFFTDDLHGVCTMCGRINAAGCAVLHSLRPFL